MAIKTFDIELVWAKMVTPRVRHLAFKPLQEGVFDFIPGQFITLNFTIGEKKYRRSYSIATQPGKSDLLEVALTYVDGGPASNLLFNLQPGDRLHAMGPAGKLVLENETAARYVLIATGTGVTPYRSMLCDFEKRMQTAGSKVLLLLGVRNPEEALYADEFEAFRNQHPGFEYHLYYSREYPKNAKTHEHQGYVQRGLSHHAWHPEQDVIYLCGNPGMIDESFEYFKAQGFANEKIRREKYISSN